MRQRRKLAAEGFNIQVNEVGFKDVLCNFTYSNGTFEDTLGYDYIRYIIPVGGEPANVTRAYYMAQIGERKEGKIKWLCDGVLINNRWILSAAHCFTMANYKLSFSRGVNPNVVRLGDLDKDDFKDPPLDRTHEFIRDYPILEVVPYPDFNINERYHDIVLIQIPRPIPLHSSTIFPICLPWETETNKDLVGMNVTLTGWGATKYNGPKTHRLQEVNLTVFDTTVCHDAYFDIPENRRSYPKGITNDKLLCVGWKEDGKDACGVGIMVLKMLVRYYGFKDACEGDSGAPIVYLKDLDLTNPRRITVKAGKECGISNENPEFPIYVQKREYVLAGIVSRGFGCGIKEFPGLYIPINKPNYLQWIKDVAFKEYV
ncbi:Clotting factor B [Armadillidium vulgare]|nr:Clotting factor B [Armadillidium vulgare]